MEPMDVEMVIPGSSNSVESITAFERTEIICKSRGSRPVPQITWRWKEKKGGSKKRNNSTGNHYDQNETEVRRLEALESRSGDSSDASFDEDDDTYIFDAESDHLLQTDQRIKRRGRREERRKNAQESVIEKNVLPDDSVSGSDTTFLQDSFLGDDTLVVREREEDRNEETVTRKEVREEARSEREREVRRVRREGKIVEKRSESSPRKSMKSNNNIQRHTLPSSSSSSSSTSSRDENLRMNEKSNVITSSATTIIRQTISSDGNLTISSLSFIPTPEDNDRILSCRVSNPLLSNKQKAARSSGIASSQQPSSSTSSNLNSIKNKSSLEVINKLNVLCKLLFSFSFCLSLSLCLSLSFCDFFSLFL